MDIVTMAVSRLKKLVPELKEVAGAVELEDAISGTKHTTPNGYVMLLGEDAAPDTNATSVITQRVTVTFGVVLAVENANKSFGIAVNTSQAQLASLRNKVREAMLGWQPEPEYDPSTYLSGQLVQVQNRVIWWQDKFQTTFHLRKIITES
jgi:hypothetical protein